MTNLNTVHSRLYVATKVSRYTNNWETL